MSDDVLLDVGDGTIWTVTLNRPQARNALTMKMTARLVEILAEAAVDPQARCLIITGAGNEAFSAGFDIKEMAGFDSRAMREAFVLRDPLFRQIAMHRLPVIAALNGKAHGAGALIAAACDFRFAGPAAEFKVTAINYGSANATWTLPRIVGLTHAKRILMTGLAISGAEGEAIGLFDAVVGNRPVLAAAVAFAGEIAAKPAAAVTAAKALTNASLDLTLEAGWEAEHRHVLEQLDMQQKGGDSVFEAFLARRT